MLRPLTAINAPPSLVTFVRTESGDRITDRIVNHTTGQTSDNARHGVVGWSGIVKVHNQFDDWT